MPSILRRTLPWLACLIGAVLAVNAFGQANYDGKGIAFNTRVTILTRGETRLSLPPLGMVSAYTHHAPVRITLELRGLNPSLFEELDLTPAARDRVLAETAVYARRGVLRAALLASFLAGAGGVLAMLLWRRSRPWHLLGAFAFATLSCSGLLVWAYADFNLEDLRQPRYQGMLESAPWIMSLLNDSFTGWRELGKGLEVMARNLPRLTRQGEGGAPMSDVGADLRVLHVSDIHNNAAALPLIRSLARSFRVDLIVDTGDLTDFGTPIEARLALGIAGLRIPYVFIPGNHDSPQLLASLAKTRGIHVVQEGIMSIKGLRILGQADPAAGTSDPGVVDEARLAENGRTLAKAWRNAKDPPDLVAVHNMRAAKSLIGKARVILHGHDHQASIKLDHGTLLLDAGTTGAAGWRGLASEKDIPYTLNLQYWRKTGLGGFALVAVDAITVHGLRGSVSVSRTMVQGEAAPAQVKGQSPG